MAAKPDYRLPMLPPFRPGFGRDNDGLAYVSSFDRDGVAWCSRGCDALTLVYRQAGLTSRDAVLIPAFHCPSIADATRRSGIQVAFHQINPDLTPVDDDVIQHLKGGARALVLIHYFGFMQDARRYRSLCDQFGALLIEDCAHAIFGLPGELLPGATGHFAIASQRKLFPVPDGGAAMASPGPMESGSLRPVTWMSELRGSLRVIQHAADYHTLGAASRQLGQSLDWLDRLRAGRKARHQHPGGAGAAPTLTRTEIPLLRESRIARRLRLSTSVSRLASLRRRNYQHMVGRLEQVPGCVPLFRDLNPGTVPYVVPIVLRNARRIFGALKARGVPMFRWEGIDGLGCEVTDNYSTDLIQLPCHQELSPADIDWIVDQLGEIAGERHV